jgi:hypothetical protein
MIPLPSLTDSAATFGFVVLLLAVAAVSSWVTRRVAEPNIVTETDTVTVAEPLAPADILSATTPTQVTEYDTSETRTQCIEVPTWLATHTTTNASSRPAPASDSVALSGALSSRLRKPLSQMRGGASGPPYAITPMTTGRPSLSVGSSEVTLSGYLPTGEGLQWTYDLPQDRWGVGLQSDFTFSTWVQGTLTADVTRHAEWGPLDVQTRFGLGYGALVTDGTAQVSPVAQAGFRIGYDW